MISDTEAAPRNRLTYQGFRVPGANIKCLLPPYLKIPLRSFTKFLAQAITRAYFVLFRRYRLPTWRIPHAPYSMCRTGFSRAFILFYFSFSLGVTGANPSPYYHAICTSVPELRLVGEGGKKALGLHDALKGPSFGGQTSGNA